MPRLLKTFRHCQPLSPCVAGLQLRYPSVTQETRKRAFTIIRSARKRTFPLRAVTIVFLGQFDVFVSPQFVTAPCHRFFPVSATLGVTRAAHHLPRSNTDTSLVWQLGVTESIVQQALKHQPSNFANPSFALLCLTDEVPEDVINLLHVSRTITFTDVRRVRRASV